ncbi:hypothetical protein Glove_23g232 [Diversispora epigaea]|uniref:Retrotransposon gag domain-containing protein n=1 Tax=Diversispora epigaea TaxID=1348612 RepID=A0A397JJ22_9GLOM|nr:hypothetical protein Glove_23g232 [Diversispora epigaea]
MLTFGGENRDPMEWLEEFNRSAKINQYTSEYKLQVVARYLQGARFELSMKIQKVNKTVEQYANDVKKLIRRIDGDNRSSEDEKIWQFLKGLRKDIAYQARPLILSQENSSLEVAIRIVKQFEENAQTYPEVTVGRDQDRNREDVIERIVQKALAPIVKKLQRITERDERPTHTFYRRPNYNNDIRRQNI